MAPSIHNYETKHAQALKALERRNVLRGNHDNIIRHDHYLAAKGLSLPRRIKYLNQLPMLSQWLNKNYLEATTDDLTGFLAHIETLPYTAWTKCGWRALIKRFWKWLKGNDQEYPKEVRWIRANLPPSQRPHPKAEDLLTAQDINNMLDITKHPRDKALISTLWETGARISEIGNLTIHDIHFDQHGALISLTGKTGPRQVRIIQTVPYLANWLQLHPRQDDPNSPIWITNSNRARGQLLTYNSFRKKLRELARRAGIKKRVNPHAFRHARATFLARHLTEFQMNNYLGWAQGSDMPSTYVHLSGRETDDALLKLNGLQPAANHAMENALKPIQCPRCKTINNPNVKFCRQCGIPMNVPMAIKAEQSSKEREILLAQVLDDDGVRRAIEEALIKTNLNAQKALTQVKPASANVAYVSEQ